MREEEGMDIEDALRSLKIKGPPPALRHRVVESSRSVPARLRLQRRLSIAAAAILLLAGILSIPFVRTSSPVSGKRQDDPPRPAPIRRWQLPFEIARYEHISLPIELFKTSRGTVGATTLVFSGSWGGFNASLVLYRAGRKTRDIQFPDDEIPSSARVDGESAALFLCGRNGITFRRIDMDSGAQSDVVELKGDFPHEDARSSLTVLDSVMMGLFVFSSGKVFVARSEDNGKTWSEARELLTIVMKEEPVGFSTQVVVGEETVCFMGLDASTRGLALLVTEDRGKNWKRAAVPRFPEGSGVPVAISGAGSGRTIQAVFQMDSGRILHAASRDSGLTWTDPKPIAETPITIFQVLHLRARDSTLAVSFTEARSEESIRARLIVSRDEGRSWSEEPVAEGIGWRSVSGGVWIEPDGDLLALLSVFLPEPGNESFLLLRRLDSLPATPAATREIANDVEKALEKLGDDRPAEREEATRSLVGLGRPGLPLLLKELEGATDPEIRSRLAQIVRDIECRWPDDQSIPKWWK